MSMQTKMRNVAVAATGVERDRVMRICMEIIATLRRDLNMKLMSTQEKHTAEVKFAIASAVIAAVQIKVASGEDPDAKEAIPLHGQDTDALGGPQGDPDGPSAG